MKSILVKINTLNEHFRSVDQPENLRLFQRITKLNEEVGELCEAALCEQDPNQRLKDKDIDFDAELADVIISALMLSTGRKKSIEAEINKKLDKILTKFNISI
jgi:NTP pyrophosphatase (non-canonical NTP hydrolase)